MKKGTLILVLAMALVGLTGRAWAAETDTIAITVSLPEIVSVSITPDTWNIGPVGFSEVHGPLAVTIENDGTVEIHVYARTTDGAGGWSSGPGGPTTNTFMIELTGGLSSPLTLTTTDQVVEHCMTGFSNPNYEFTYYSPTGNSLPGGDQSCTVTFTAVVPTP